MHLLVLFFDRICFINVRYVTRSLDVCSCRGVCPILLGCYTSVNKFYNEGTFSSSWKLVNHVLKHELNCIWLGPFVFSNYRAFLQTG